MPTNKRNQRGGGEGRDDSEIPIRKFRPGQQHGRPQPSHPSAPGRHDQRVKRAQAFGGQSEGGQNYEQRFSGAEFGSERAPKQGGGDEHQWAPWGQQSERYDDQDKKAWNNMASEGGDRVGMQQHDEDADEFSDFGRGFQRGERQSQGWQRYATGGQHRDGDVQQRTGGEQPRPAEPQYPRGPKGYKRSDERLREDVSDRIARTPNIDASDVEVAVSGGEVTLSGTVPRRSMKWELEQLAESVHGVIDVHVTLRVKRAGEPMPPTEGPDRGPHSNK